MINALHLLWIIPISVVAGMGAAVFFFAVGSKNKEYEAYLNGLNEGIQSSPNHTTPNPRMDTLKDYFQCIHKNDFNKFKRETGGIIYGEHPDGQLSVIQISTPTDLDTYYNNKIVSTYNTHYVPIIEVCDDLQRTSK